MANIVVIGSANLDNKFNLKCQFTQNVKLDELKSEIISTSSQLGGKGANQAIAIKHLIKSNDEVYFITCVGQDANAEQIIKKLKQENINIDGIQQLTKCNSDGRNIYVDLNGENKMEKGTDQCIQNLTLQNLETEKTKEILKKADIVVIQMKMPNETSENIIQYCIKHKKLIFVDPTPPQNTAFLTKYLDKITYVKPNKKEAFYLSQYLKGYNYEQIKNMEISEKEIKELVEKYQNIVVTLGEKGVLYNNNGKLITKSPYKTQCKDSTGAGDTFMGGLVSSISNGRKIDQAVEYAAMASAIKVKTEGAQNGIPTYKQVETELNEILNIR